MSFDVFLIRFKDGKSAEIDRSPICGLLKTTAYGGPDEYGFYDVVFADGLHVQFYAPELESKESFTACSFEIRGFSDVLVKFILDMARAGDMVIFPAMKGNPLIMVAEQQRSDVPASLLEEFQSMVVSTAGELGVVLRGGFEGWKAYLDHVLRQRKADGDA